MTDINWGKGILSVLGSVFVTVIAGLIIFFIQTKEPKLVYSFEDSLPFENQNERLTIYHITVENIGSDVATDIITTIKLTPAIVKEYRINSEAPIEFNEKVDSLGMKIETTSLNPSENFRISVLATSNSLFPLVPSIHVRGKGLNGEKKENKKESIFFDDTEFSVIKMAIASLIGLVTASTLTLIFRRKLGGDGLQHRGDQNQIIAYLCGLHGLDNQVERYLTLASKTTYWAEMDRLASTAIYSEDNNLKIKVRTIISDLIDYAGMADSSVGIGYYNIARLEKSLNNEAKALEFLDKAKKTIPKLLKTRLKLDPLFN